MSNKYDVESHFKALLAIVKDNLNAKINEINVEKDDNFNLATFIDEQYYTSTADSVYNYDEFIYCDLVDLQTESVGASTSIKVGMVFEVVFSNFNQIGTLEKILRYSRCLREVIQEHWKRSSNCSGLKIEEILPTNIQLNQGSDFKVGGVSVTSTITV